MRAKWYILTLVLGLFGALSVLANLEQLVLGERSTSTAAGLLLGLVVLYFAWKALGKARAAAIKN